jgi:predicted nucleotidyltransferase
VTQNARRLREIAVQAMNFLVSFDPRLVGSVLSGNVTPTSEVQLHVSADSPEEIALFLGERAIPFELGERRVRFGGERYKNVAAYTFVADGVTVELSVFDPRTARETPLSPVDGQPIRRGNMRELVRLLNPNTCSAD